MIIFAKNIYTYRTHLIAALITLLPLSSDAIDMPDWYLSVGLSHISSDSKRSSDNDTAPNISIGRMFGDYYSLDLEYNDYTFDDSAARRIDFDGFNLTGRYYFLGNDKTSPYVGLGFGSLERNDLFGSDSDTHLDVSAGLHWLIDQRWGLRGELRHRFAGDNDASPNVSSFEDFEDSMVSLSLTYALSPRVNTASRSKPVRSQNPPNNKPVTPKTTFILLPDEDGAVGRLVVSNDGGQQEISQAGYAVETANTVTAPAKPKKVSLGEVDTMFDAAQDAFPASPRHYQLYFEFESDELTVDSKAQIPEIIATIEEHKTVEVAVVGHSDTSGNPTYNLTLSEHRANAIVQMLIEKGVRKDVIESRFDGESNPVIPTADNVKERKNRRVEITIR